MMSVRGMSSDETTSDEGSELSKPRAAEVPYMRVIGDPVENSLHSRCRLLSRSVPTGVRVLAPFRPSDPGHSANAARPFAHHVTGHAVRRNRFRSANASRCGHDAAQA